MSAPKTIAVDFDGTICGFAYPGIGAPKEGVREALSRFRALGYQVMIYSCRTCSWYPEIFTLPGEDISTPEARMSRKVVTDMVDYLREHQIPYDSIDDGSMGKPLADFYIDDKGIRFQDNWTQIADVIERMDRARRARTVENTR